MKKSLRTSRQERFHRFGKVLEAQLNKVARETKTARKIRAKGGGFSAVIPILSASQKLLRLSMRSTMHLSLGSWLEGYTRGYERYRSATFTLRDDILKDGITLDSRKEECLHLLIAIERGLIGIPAQGHLKALRKILYDRDRVAEALHAALCVVEYSLVLAKLHGVSYRKAKFNSLKGLCEEFTTPHEHLSS